MLWPAPSVPWPTCDRDLFKRFVQLLRALRHPAAGAGESTAVNGLNMAEIQKHTPAFTLKHTDSIRKALQLSSQSFDQTRSDLRSRLSLRDCQQQPLSHSVSDAQAAVQTREDDKKKQQARKDKAKSSTPTPAQEACPGAEQGAESTKSAYWLFMEVTHSNP